MSRPDPEDGGGARRFPAPDSSPAGRSSVERKAARGFVLTLGAQVARTVIALGSAALLARLLGPEPYGLFSMVTVVTGFLFVFNEVGLSLATIQKETLEDTELNSLFWLQLALSSVVAVVACAASPALAWFYGEPRLTGMTIAMAPAFVMMGVYSQPRALLRRALEYRTVATIEVMAALLAAVLAAVVALQGGRHWALVMQLLAQYFVLLVGFSWSCRWRPSRPRIERSVLPHVEFGRHFFGHRVLEYVAVALDRALLGAFFGPTTLGLYERASSLLAAPMSQMAQPMTMVLVPALSRLQSDPAAFRDLFIRYFRVLAWFTLPLMGFLVGSSREVVGVLLGPKWHAAVEIFAVAAVGAALAPLAATRSWLLLPLGRTRTMWRLGVAMFPLLIIAVAVAAPRGAVPVAASRSIWTVLLACVGLGVAAKGTLVAAPQLLRVVAAPALTGIGLALTCHWASSASGGEPLAGLLRQAAVAVVWTGLAIVVSGDLRRVRESVSQ